MRTYSPNFDNKDNLISTSVAAQTHQMWVNMKRVEDKDD